MPKEKDKIIKIMDPCKNSVLPDSETFDTSPAVNDKEKKRKRKKTRMSLSLYEYSFA